jgi:hypothetical protein
MLTRSKSEPFALGTWSSTEARSASISVVSSSSVAQDAEGGGVQGDCVAAETVLHDPGHGVVVSGLVAGELLGGYLHDGVAMFAGPGGVLVIFDYEGDSVPALWRRFVPAVVCTSRTLADATSPASFRIGRSHRATTLQSSRRGRFALRTESKLSKKLATTNRHDSPKTACAGDGPTALRLLGQTKREPGPSAETSAEYWHKKTATIQMGLLALAQHCETKVPDILTPMFPSCSRRDGRSHRA